MKGIIKKTVKELTLLILLFITISNTANAQYTLSDADVVVTAEGFIQSCSYDFAIKNIIIPAMLDGQLVKGVVNSRSASGGMFYNKGIKSLVLPDGMTYIGDYAFYGNAIAKVNLPNSLTYIGITAFNNNLINEINGLPSDGIIFARKADASIDDATIVSFGGATKEVRIPTTVVTIREDVFRARGLTSVDFSGCTALTTIGKRAFNQNSITDVNLSDCSSLTTIVSSAFWNSGIRTLSLSGCTSLSTIGAYAFRANAIASIDLSSCTALTTLQREAFRSNSLSEVTLPPGLNTIGAAAFNQNAISKVNGVAFDGIFYALNEDTSVDYTRIVSYGGASKEVIIPAQVECIGSSAFAYARLTSINLSGCTALAKIGNSAFYSGALAGVDLSECTALSSIERGAFYGNPLTEFALPTPIIAGFYFNHWADGSSNEYAGGVTVTGLNTSYSANLTAYYKVSFSISDGTDPIEGVSVQLDGYGTVTTNASGIADFERVLVGNGISYTVSATNYDEASGTISVVDKNVSKEVSLMIPTGFNEMQKSSISVYPNPVANKLFITQESESRITRIEIYNIKGKRVDVKTIVSEQIILPVDLNRLAPGTYVIKCFMSNNQIISKQIVKK